MHTYPGYNFTDAYIMVTQCHICALAAHYHLLQAPSHSSAEDDAFLLPLSRLEAWVKALLNLSWVYEKADCIAGHSTHVSLNMLCTVVHGIRRMLAQECCFGLHVIHHSPATKALTQAC